MSRLSAVLSLALVAGTLALGPAHAKKPKPPVGQFDYYAMALSWSPAYCAGHSDPDQCSTGRGLGFVLHGLWPQYEKGYPQSCSNVRLPGDVRSKYASIYPSPKLIGHEWDKHGTCSGLEPAAYFELSSQLKSQLAIPAAYLHPVAPVRVSYDDFVRAFGQANPASAADSIVPFCSSGGRFLSELHACFARDGKSRSCGASEVKRAHNSCRQDTFLLQNVR